MFFDVNFKFFFPRFSQLTWCGSKKKIYVMQRGTLDAILLRLAPHHVNVFWRKLQILFPTFSQLTWCGSKTTKLMWCGTVLLTRYFRCLRRITSMLWVEHQFFFSHVIPIDVMRPKKKLMWCGVVLFTRDFWVSRRITSIFFFHVEKLGDAARYSFVTAGAVGTSVLRCITYFCWWGE